MFIASTRRSREPTPSAASDDSAIAVSAVCDGVFRIVPVVAQLVAEAERDQPRVVGEGAAGMERGAGHVVLRCVGQERVPSRVVELVELPAHDHAVDLERHVVASWSIVASCVSIARNLPSSAPTPDAPYVAT